MSVWIEVKANLPEPPEDWSRWTFVFEQHGFLGTVQTDWPPTLATYALPGQEPETAALTAELEALGAKVETREVPEENWAEAWKEYFKPKAVGATWLIQPSWEEAEPAPDRLKIVLDPGQAFGTGDHQTTRGCLVLMEDLDLKGKTVADIGCGSGILSIAAKLMGAAQVVGVDVEMASVEASIENAVRNNVEVDFWRGLGFDPLPEDEKYDLVLSNIISAALIDLAPEAGRRVKPGGTWITSGVIEANWLDVLKAAEREGFRLQNEIREDDWVTARFLR